MVNNSATNQSFAQCPVVFPSTTAINAAAGDLTFGDVNIGAGTTLTFRGTATTSTTIGGAISGTGVITVSSGTLIINSNNPTWAPASAGHSVLINGSGVVRISKNNSLGDTTGTTNIPGGAENGRLELTGGITVPEKITVGGKNSSTNAAISNFSGKNTISGALTTATGGMYYNFRSDAGTLILSNSAGFTSPSTATGTRRINLMGAGDGEFTGPINDQSPANDRKFTSLFKYDDGTWTLAGNNTTAAELRVYGNGTVNIGKGGTTGEWAGNIVFPSSAGAGATLVFNRSSDYTYTKIISGSAVGTVTKKAANTLTLTGSCTFTGQTKVDAGTLQIGNGGTTGGYAGDIALNSPDTALVFNRSNAYSYTGIVSGTGTLTQAGTGLLTLTGNNSYSGATIISAGTLALSDTGQIANSASIANVATFQVLAGTHAVNAITGTGITVVNNDAVLTASSIAQESLTIGGASAVALPEPGTFALLILCGLAMAAFALRRS